MTPPDKYALELVNKFLRIYPVERHMSYIVWAKMSALIAVEEILSIATPILKLMDAPEPSFWQLVKIEINKL